MKIVIRKYLSFETRAKPLGISLIIDDIDNLDASQVFGAIFSILEQMVMLEILLQK